MSESTPDPWLEFTFNGPDGSPIDARAVGQMLLDLIAAARQIAVDVLHLPEPNGPMSAEERALAALTLKAIGPGSIARVELAPPATEPARQAVLGEEVVPIPTANQVIHQLELDLLESANGAMPHRPKRRESIVALKKSLTRIAPAVSIAGTYTGEFRRLPVYRRETKEKTPVEVTERRVYFGRATMADSDPSRRRLRATLYDGKRFLLDVADDFATPLSDIFDRDVEFRVIDTIDAGVVVKSTVDAVRPLELAEVGIDFPARDWRRLAKEQGVDLVEPPDYVQLLQELFDSESEIEAFKHHIVASRGGYEPDD